MHQQTIGLNRSLVLSAIHAIEEWEKWSNVVPQGAARALNFSLIRLTKGLVKAWRLYLIEQGSSQTNGNTQGHDALPPPNNGTPS